MANFADFISVLHSAKQQSIVWHHQVKGTASYAAHVGAFEGFYTEIVGITDGLVESVSGIYGRPVDYSVMDLVNFTSIEDSVTYFKELYTHVEDERKNVYQESWIQNQIDEVSQLIAETLYRLTLS